MGVEELPIILTYEDLQAYTDHFSDKNYIGEFQFGEIYHGKIPQSDSAQPKPVTVKVWGVPKWYTYFVNESIDRLMDEVVFLQKNSHPGLMKLYGYCCETEKCGIVYDFKSFNTVHNLATSDDFKWWQRIKVAYRFARLLRFLHVKYQGTSPLVIRNIDAAHVMVDEDWNPKLYDFSLVTGGLFLNKLVLPIQHVHGCYGYMEPMGEISQKSDMYAFGIVLLSLLMKEVYTAEERLNGRPCLADRAFAKYGGYTIEDIRKEVKGFDIDKWINGEDEKEENFMFSLVHGSLEADESFCTSDGPKITRLALSCVNCWPENRPKAKKVIQRLEKLKVSRLYLRDHIERKMKKENIPFPPCPQ